LGRRSHGDDERNEYFTNRYASPRLRPTSALTQSGQKANDVTDEITILDSFGERLRITANLRGCEFDTATYSDAVGFTPLCAVVRDFPQLGLAQRAARERREVCVLPRLKSPPFRILITPSIRSTQPETRFEAKRLMLDLFEASQTPDVRARNLVITHFAWVRRYPEPHINGIFDAIVSISRGSFRGLRVLGFKVCHPRRFCTDLVALNRRLVELGPMGPVVE
jgi:hypothetical protein